MQVYTYVKTMTVDHAFNSRWQEHVNGQETLLNLCTTCREALIVLYNTVSQQQEALSLNSIRSTSIDLTRSIDQYLQVIDNATLVTTGVPVIKPRLVRYRNAVRCGYKADIVKAGYADDSLLSSVMKTDLKLTREDVDYADVNRYCLISINGYYHMFDATSQGVYINDAMQSVRVCGYNQIGLHNFREVGSIEKHPLSGATIYPSVTGNPLKDQLRIDLKINASNKYAIFFVGGYMIPSSGSIITQMSDTTWSMAFNKFDWLDRFFEMNRFLNLESLGILASPSNENAFYKHEISADQTIRNLFKLPQSFVALVDTPSFFVDKAVLPITRLPGMYRSYGKFENLPMQVGHGRMAEYWLSKDDGVQKSDALFVADGYKFQRNYNSADADAALVVDPKRPAGHRIDISDAWMLSMGRDF